MRAIAGLGMVALLASAAAAQSDQQRYAAAQTAFDKGDWPAAAEGFAAVLPKLSGRSGGIVRSRYAVALSQLRRSDEALEAAERGAAALAGPGADDERATAWLTLALIRLNRLELPEAIDALRQARSALTPGSALGLNVAIAEIKASIVLDPPTAISHGDTLLRSPAYTALPTLDQAQLQVLVARAKLIGGDAAAALPLVREALRRSGGTETSRVNSVQAVIRNDAAMVFLRTDNPDEARRALASAGGGYMPTSNWLSGGENEPPVCDGVIKPEDVAVVQFDVDDQGDVEAATPVYASRPGEMGIVFARQVQQWHFPSGSFAKLEPFWRQGVRLEMRCVTRPASDALSKPFTESARAWFAANGVAWGRPGDGPLTYREIGSPPARIRPVLDLLHRARDSHRTEVRPEALDAALSGAGAPVDVQALFAWMNARTGGATFQMWGSRQAAALRPLAERFEREAGGAHAAAWLWVETALAREAAGDFAGARPLLERANAAPEEAVDARDPIRLVATLHLSLIDRRLGDAATAERRLASAGLDAEQCALFDVRPVQVAGGASSNDFPNDVLRWAMEGFAQSAFDIAPDGKVTDVRIIKAYPPFVFGPSTQKIIQRSRFLPPTLNNVALGCSAQTKGVNFRVPHS